VISKILPKVKDCLLCENSPNLVTLIPNTACHNFLTDLMQRKKGVSRLTVVYIMMIGSKRIAESGANPIIFEFTTTTPALF
jgi:hypothetical protein